MSGLQADTVLWSNYGGSLSNINIGFGSDNRCDASCGSLTNYTVFDNFTAANPGWVATKFVYYDFFNNTATSEYQSTSWSLWKGDPLTTGTLVASGTGALGSLNNISGMCSSTTTCLESITVTLPGSGVVLSSGQTYYLGISNVLGKSTDATDRAVVMQTYSNGSLSGWEQSNGSISGSSWTKGGQDYNFPNSNPNVNAQDTAFDIIGSPVPEPGTLSLLSFALAGLGFVVRRRRASI